MSNLLPFQYVINIKSYSQDGLCCLCMKFLQLVHILPLRLISVWTSPLSGAWKARVAGGYCRWTVQAEVMVRALQIPDDIEGIESDPSECSGCAYPIPVALSGELPGLASFVVRVTYRVVKGEIWNLLPSLLIC